MPTVAVCPIARTPPCCCIFHFKVWPEAVWCVSPLNDKQLENIFADLHAPPQDNCHMIHPPKFLHEMTKVRQQKREALCGLLNNCRCSAHLFRFQVGSGTAIGGYRGERVLGGNLHEKKLPVLVGKEGRQTSQYLSKLPGIFWGTNQWGAVPSNPSNAWRTGAYNLAAKMVRLHVDSRRVNFCQSFTTHRSGILFFTNVPNLFAETVGFTGPKRFHFQKFRQLQWSLQWSVQAHKQRTCRGLAKNVHISLSPAALEKTLRWKPTKRS